MLDQTQLIDRVSHLAEMCDEAKKTMELAQGEAFSAIILNVTALILDVHREVIEVANALNSKEVKE